MGDTERLECPVCGKSLTKAGLSGHLTMKHGFRKPADMNQYEFAEAVENGEIERQTGEPKSEKEEGSGMEEDTDYLNELFESIESQSGYYKDPGKRSGSKSKSKKSNEKGGNFFPSFPGLDFGKWGKRLAIAGLAAGGLVLVSKNWEGISNSLQEANETKDRKVGPKDVKDSGKNNGKKRKDSSSESFARISDL